MNREPEVEMVEDVAEEMVFNPMEGMQRDTGYTVEKETSKQEFREYNNPKSSQEEELLPNLYESDINSWKKQFGEVFMAVLKEDTYVFRPLNRYEYKEILSLPNTDALMREEIICEYCVLYPQGFDFSTIANGKAGVPAMLSEKIMEQSNFTTDITVTKL